jgi:hypothetical protein
MKRVLQFSDWLTTEVLEGVTHQQYVFTIPKIIRPYFKYDRGLLGKLCLCAWETIKEFFGACLPEGAVPGAVISIQTWGIWAPISIHTSMVTKGGFDAYGIFHPLELPSFNYPFWVIFNYSLQCAKSCFENVYPKFSLSEYDI